MEIDGQELTEEAQAQINSKAEGKKPQTIIVDDAHPFELDTYISGYTGRGAINRLFHIIQHCPQLAAPAYQMAVQRILQTNDPGLYRTAVSLLNASTGAEPGKGTMVDTRWASEVASRNTRERNRLEVELKTYQSNMIKESIRMAHRDLGDFYRSTGDDASALKHYTKSREFVTSSQHILDMCISVLELLLEQRNYSHVTTYVFKAEAALDAAVGTAGGPSSNGGSGTGAAQAAQLHKKAAVSPERERVQAKLDVATALSLLSQGLYEKTAQTLLKLPAPKALGDWVGKIINPGDIAIIGTLCALASFTRPVLKAQLLQNDSFGVYLEHEPYVREILEAYMNSHFKTVLELLERYSSRHFLDVYLSAHSRELTNRIRDRALVLYFRPFATIRLQRMGAAFGLSVDELERLIVALIQSGEIKARVDSQNKILKANVTDQRAALFARAIQAGAQIQAANRKLLLRMRLQQADLIIKAPRSQQGPSNAEVIME